MLIVLPELLVISALVTGQVMMVTTAVSHNCSPPCCCCWDDTLHCRPGSRPGSTVIRDIL